LFDAIRRLLEADSLSPHGICLLWRPELIWTHAISDAVIGLAYFSIPIALASFVSRRRDVAFTWVFWAFAVFILACGATHFFSIWTLWFPDYGAEALLKAVTAAASIATAIALWPLLPKALALPSPAQLRLANEGLEQRIRERDEALEALRRETAERLKAEEMLRQAQKMEALGQLTGGIAHDFNNLLTIVIGSLEMIDRRAGDDRALRRALDNAQTATERAATLTQQLLAFARKQSLQPVDQDINTLVRRVLDLLERTLGERISLRADLAPDLVSVHIDPNQLESALLNLAVNARDAMPEGGVLTIRTRNVADDEGVNETAGPPGRGRFVLIEVGDTGTGMSEDVRAKAFEPFFTTKPVGRGSGLGLSQVQGFVTQSGGRVAIESAPGRGASIRLYLPQGAAQPAKRPEVVEVA
jgi:signal transduction histidine kinase